MHGMVHYTHTLGLAALGVQTVKIRRDTRLAPVSHLTCVTWV